MKDYKTAAPDRYELLKTFAKKNRKNPTLAENILWQHLRYRQMGVQFVRQHVIGDYIVDFAAPDIGLVVEVDGGYHSEPRQEVNDEMRSNELWQMGFRVIRFTNEEVMYDINNVTETIKKEL